MPRFKSMPGAGVLFVAALGLAASASVFLLPVEPPVGGECPNSLVCEVSAPEGGRLGVGFEFGAGYNAQLCRFVTLPASPATRDVSLPLPAGRIEVLRFFASSPSVQAGIHAVRVVDFRGNVVRRFGDADLRADGRIALRGPILLPTVPRTGDPVVRRERLIAGLLVAAEAVALALLWRRRNRGSMPAWLYHAAVGLSAVAVAFARRPSVFAHPQFWAEDGTVFFPARIDGWHGFLRPRPTISRSFPGSRPSLPISLPLPTPRSSTRS
jgi:hypothetical protein